MSIPFTSPHAPATAIDRRRINDQTVADQVDIVTGSRLHFGLLSLQPVDGFCYGGCGLMIRRPSVWVQARRSRQFRFTGEMPERCLAVVDRFVARFELKQRPPIRLRLLSNPDAHTGLGSGTQIDLAIAHALVAACGAIASPESIAIEIARRARRSAIGVHGFARGGLIAEAGICHQQPMGKLLSAGRFPRDWRILLVRPKTFHLSVHGELETDHFQRLTGQADASDPSTSQATGDTRLRTFCAEQRCAEQRPAEQRPAEHGRRDQTQTAVQTRRHLESLMQEQMVPAAASVDFERFCDAVSQFNYQSGRLFADVQHSAYNGAQLESLVNLMRDCGCQGVGQSSWGPTIFAFCRDQSEAAHHASLIRAAAGDDCLDIEITQARNQPASCRTKFLNG